MLPPETMDIRRRLRIALARSQIAFGAVALRAGMDIGMLEGPAFTLPAGPIPAFDAVIDNATDGVIDYQLDEPKYEFLSYLVHARGYLLHGTAPSDIAEIEPRQATDYEARVVDAVFATSDGIWPLFFATLDRSRAGSLWNGCYHVRRGRVIRRYYFFFTEADPQNEGIWRNGTIYVVPSRPFTRTWIPNEWICRQPVAAVAKLAVTPADFPLRQRVKQFETRFSLMGNLRRFSR
jgi:hypothetical protein